MATAAARVGETIRGLFDDANAVLVGLPAGFSIDEELRGAKHIRIATAFAHISGWRRLERSICDSPATVRLLTSLAFFQTEPKLLREWRKLCYINSSANGESFVTSLFEARLRPAGGPLFHPKVLIATDQDDLSGFAIVGSGNLSDGGLCKNIECGTYIGDAPQIAALINWFDYLFDESKLLTDEAINKYDLRYKRAHQYDKKVRSEEKELAKELATIAWRWEDAAKEARQYYKTTKSQMGWRKRSQGAAKIRQTLHSPEFEFTSKEWADFYDIHELGHLNPIYRDRVFKKKARLRAALRQLIKPPTSLISTLDQILRRGGKLHIEGFGLNTISKILACYFPENWPVYNTPVAKAIRYFGYRKQRGVSAAEAYIAFAAEMRRLMKYCGATDVYAVDAFMHHYYVTRIKPKIEK